MGVFYPGYARFRREERRKRRWPGLSFISVVSLLLRWFRLVMGFSFARDDDDEESASSRSTFAGDADSYPEWSFRTRAHMRTKKVTVGTPPVEKSLWAWLSKSEPPSNFDVDKTQE